MTMEAYLNFSMKQNYSGIWIIYNFFDFWIKCSIFNNPLSTLFLPSFRPSINDVGQFLRFFDPLPPPSRRRRLWMAPYINVWWPGPSLESFKNYVGIILFLFMNTYPPLVTWVFFAMNMDKNGNFSTTHPPHLVHVVVERPLLFNTMVCFCNLSMLPNSGYVDWHGLVPVHLGGRQAFWPQYIY